MSKVSVHIVTYNSEAYIQDCLDAVLAQNYPIQSIIVFDNNSSDQTEKLLEPYFNRIQYVRNRENIGFAAGHNHVIHLSDSDYYLVLNPDVKLHPDYVVVLMNQFKLTTALGSVTGKLLFKHSPTIIDSTGLTLTKTRRAFDRGTGNDSNMWNQSGDVFGVSGATALYSKEMVEAISVEGSFFDDDFFAYKEDVDVAWRSRIYGWKSFYCANALAYHDRGWKKGLRNDIPLFIRKYSYINRYKMIIKNDSFAHLLKHFIPLIIYELASFFYLLLKEPKVLTAWSDFFASIPKLLLKRKVIQSARRVDFNSIYSYFK